MVGKAVFLVVALLLMAQVSLAAENSLVITLIDGSAIVEHSFNLSEAKDVKIILPLDAEAIEMQDSDFKVLTREDFKELTVAGITETKLTYISEGFIEQTKDSYFTLNLALIKGTKEVLVVLPEFASLKYPVGSPKASVIPSSSELKTDGQKIEVFWDENSLAEANSLLIIYKEPRIIDWVALLKWVMVVLIFLTGLYLLKRRKVSDGHEISRNLFEEEKAIVEFLSRSKDKEAWQKSILLELGVSKVRLSRKLRALESKGLIEKVPFGNTNKIRLK